MIVKVSPFTSTREELHKGAYQYQHHNWCEERNFGLIKVTLRVLHNQAAADKVVAQLHPLGFENDIPKRKAFEPFHEASNRCKSKAKLASADGSFVGLYVGW